MNRTKKVVPLSGERESEAQIFLHTQSDLDALRQAQRLLGADARFQVWEGERLAFTYDPARTARSRERGAPV